jgi:hypothetical protein
MADDDVWRRRLLAYTAVRAAGLAIFFLGVAIAYSGLAREGGWPQLGAIVAILGAVDALFTPRLLKKLWEGRDRDHGS